MNALTHEVSELVGFVPDYRVFIGWELVGKMVDAIGGVTFDVPFHMEYDDPEQDLHIYIEKGVQVLDGEKAMQLVRWRKNNKGVSGGGGGSDLNRLKVQQAFLKAVLEQTLQIKNIGKIDELVKLFGTGIEGNLSVKNLTWFAKEAVFGGLNVSDVEFVTMPWKGADPYVYPDQEKLLTLINTKLNPFNTDITVNELDLIYLDAEGNMHATSDSRP
jgi:LCP family protein required for cell wall assembly